MDELLRIISWKTIKIQRTNTTYDSVDFGDPMSIVSYFKKLLEAKWMRQKDVNLIVNKIMARIIDKETKDGMKALSIMKSTADKIHGAFQELSWDGDHTTAKATESKNTTTGRISKFVSNAIKEAVEGLESLTMDLNSESDPNFKKISS